MLGPAGEIDDATCCSDVLCLSPSGIAVTETAVCLLRVVGVPVCFADPDEPPPIRISQDLLYVVFNLGRKNISWNDTRGCGHVEWM